jgi:hypothetical protein
MAFVATWLLWAHFFHSRLTIATAIECYRRRELLLPGNEYDLHTKRCEP